MLNLIGAVLVVIAVPVLTTIVVIGNGWHRHPLGAIVGGLMIPFSIVLGIAFAYVLFFDDIPSEPMSCRYASTVKEWETCIPVD